MILKPLYRSNIAKKNLCHFEQTYICKSSVECDSRSITIVIVRSLCLVDAEEHWKHADHEG